MFFENWITEEIETIDKNINLYIGSFLIVEKTKNFTNSKKNSKKLKQNRFSLRKTNNANTYKNLEK